MLNDWNTVNVIEGRLTQKSKCNIKRCKRKPKFMVFNDDGKTNLSRLFFCSCERHLPEAVRRAWSENRDKKSIITRKEAIKAKEEAKKLLGVK